MTALEYMTKQVQKHRLNYEREAARGIPEDMLRNIKAKIGYYEEAVAALTVCDSARLWMLTGNKCEICLDGEDVSMVLYSKLGIESARIKFCPD